jgi:hypothetical protein
LSSSGAEPPKTLSGADEETAFGRDLRLPASVFGPKRPPGGVCVSIDGNLSEPYPLISRFDPRICFNRREIYETSDAL